MIYLRLFWSFLQVGLFSIGGGYAAVPLIQNQMVDVTGWMSLTEFADVLTISQMTPGPIAINSATFVGLKVGGLLGAVIATIGCILPGCLIAFAFSYIYKKYKDSKGLAGVMRGLRPTIVALIASAAFSLLLLVMFNGMPYEIGNIRWPELVIFAIALFVLRKWKVDQIFVILGTGVLGLLLLVL